MDKKPYHHLPDGTFRNPEGSPVRSKDVKFSYTQFIKEKKRIDLTVPKDVEEMDKLSHDAYLQSAQRDQNIGQIAIAYTVWSKKKGGGKLIVKEVFKKIKKSNHLNRLVTLSPLTEMATKFHSRNGAKLLQINETTQNFEYKVI